MFCGLQRTVDRQRFTEEPLRLVEVALLSRHHGEITEIAAHCRMPLPECPSVKRKGFADERIRFLGSRRSMKEHLPQPVEAARHAWMGRAERPLLNAQRQTVKPLCPFEVAQKLFGRSEVVHRLRCERVGGSQPTLPDAKSLAQERSGVGVIALGVQQSGKAMPALGYGQATVSMQCSSDGESLTGTRPGPDEVLAVPEQLGQVLEALRRGVMLFPKERSPLGERT